jgi:transposase-like protein
MNENLESNDELNLITLAQQYADEDKARELFESLRWPNGPVCPHCRNDGKAKAIYPLVQRWTSKAPVRRGVYKCGACREQFTATVNTVLEASHIPISKWMMALFILCSSKKSISAHQLHRMIKVTYKTAWFMAHRIRFGMQPENDTVKRKQANIKTTRDRPLPDLRGMKLEDAVRAMFKLLPHSVPANLKDGNNLKKQSEENP